MENNQNNQPKTEGYHYQYDADKDHAASKRSDASKGSNELLNTAIRILLIGPIILGIAIFGAILLTGFGLTGGLTVALAGGTIFSMVTSAHFLANGMQQLAILTGGLGLLALSGFGLSVFGFVYWIRKIAPEFVKRYRRFCSWVMGKKEA